MDDILDADGSKARAMRQLEKQQADLGLGAKELKEIRDRARAAARAEAAGFAPDALGEVALPRCSPELLRSA